MTDTTTAPDGAAVPMPEGWSTSGLDDTTGHPGALAAAALAYLLAHPDARAALLAWMDAAELHKGTPDGEPYTAEDLMEDLTTSMHWLCDQVEMSTALAKMVGAVKTALPGVRVTVGAAAFGPPPWAARSAFSDELCNCRQDGWHVHIKPPADAAGNDAGSGAGADAADRADA